MVHRRRFRKNFKNKIIPRNDFESTVTVKNFESISVQTDDEMPQTVRKRFEWNDLDAVNRITNIPIVETGWSYAGGFYQKIKNSNSLMHWTLDTAELSAQTIVEAASPALFLLEGPINSIDDIVCKSLDILEQKVPSINLPPEMIYYNTKQYVQEMGTRIAQPVIKRADSVKKIGDTVLSSKYTAYAADTLDGVLDVAEKYVDKYLPGEDEQIIDETDKPANEEGPKGKAIHTIHHAEKFSRKLKRKVTLRTIAEVKALKHQSVEAVHVLTYVIELVATDPILAFQKGKELWASLSKDEPENQARPANLEQLIVLLVRESSRRVVHLINASSDILSTFPRRLYHSVGVLINKVLATTDSAVKTVHMENVQGTIIAILKAQGYVLAVAIKNINDQISEYLEQVAENLSKHDENSPGALSVPQITVNNPKATLKNTKQNSNGFENNL
ncbi:lipid storage droplets surface-binding protein 1-like isoform X1 [Diorhabda carinulata]|uniref:lipid storage droplets surface-binding protein 1-like isoform X1 n=2 Tax=Diorhabda carinulata TaxID=1163345 RepID=UPI0025A1F491|nr:lipid storage droplets surface-binding protein 1-like isoform X1 [Diorhabda carinulata]